MKTVTVKRCEKNVPNEGRLIGFHRCSRKVWKDGYCKQHHPDTKAAREKKRDDKDKATYQVWDLKAAIKIIEKECVAFVYAMTVYAMTDSDAKATELVKKLTKLKEDLSAAKDELSKY